MEKEKNDAKNLEETKVEVPVTVPDDPGSGPPAR